ncbi:ABC transporter permease [Parahaliea mediterranea]|uniref:ABC transporter permease n=1 Tax=Parahaliea mediterranea TaxID=651086 RepID=UPI000E2E6F99|nr:ABC transporter permease [Parahaliea mediterranea]
MFFRLTLASLWNRRGSAVLTLLAVTVSVFVLLGVEQIRHQARASFGNTVSGIDLIVGARTGDINLLLYSVFRLGNATNNINWQSYREIADDPGVAWTIPISLGDSHRGYRVMGTTGDYFTHFHYGQDRPLQLAKGAPFSDRFDVVLGSEVAHSLGYQLKDKLVLAHGLGSTSFSQHADTPFQVTGILAPTGTPVDQTLHVSLQGIEAMHIGWRDGVKLPGASHRLNENTRQELTPESITAFMVGLTSKLNTFRLQRQINTYRAEPLLAILPGVTLAELWQMTAIMENALRLTSALVLLASLLGLAAMLLASLRERQREVAVLRAIGASPWFLLALIEAEALIITVGGSLLALALLSLCTTLSADGLAAQISLFIESAAITRTAPPYLLAIVAGAMAIALVPGIRIYRSALAQQLTY